MNRVQTQLLLTETRRMLALCLARLQGLQFYIEQNDIESLALRYRADIDLTLLKLESLEAALTTEKEPT